MRQLRSLLACAAVLCYVGPAFGQVGELDGEGPGGVEKYKVRYISESDAPVIDGVADDAIWLTGAAGGGYLGIGEDGSGKSSIDATVDPSLVENPGDKWNVIRQPITQLDNEGSRFISLYSNEAWYVLIQSNYDQWTENSGPGLTGNTSFNEDNWNLYIDPNLDDEPATAGNQDAYQMNPQAREGFGEYRGGANPNVAVPGVTEGNNMGYYYEGHINGLFGNPAGGSQGTNAQEIAQINKPLDLITLEPGEGVLEWRIPWSDFDVPNNPGGESFGGSGVDEAGLAHGFSPGPGDDWLVNIDKISTQGGSNFLPSWNWYSGNFLANRPSGVWEFQNDVPGSSGESVFTGDTDLDGDVDIFDILNINAGRGGGNQFGVSNTNPRWKGGDFNDDNQLDIFDILALNIQIAGVFPFPGSPGIPAIPGGSAGAGEVELTYDPATGGLSYAGNGSDVTTIALESAGDNFIPDSFTGDAQFPQNNSTDLLGVANIGIPLVDQDFGPVLTAGLDIDALRADLTVTGISPDVNVVLNSSGPVIPEPSSLVLMALGMVGLAYYRRRVA